MQCARYHGRDEILQALIAAGPALDVFEAATLDRADDLASILDRDPALARVHSADGFTPLHLAAFYAAPAALALLLDRGADVRARTTNFLDNMPLHAAAAGAAPLPMCRILLDRGADVNARQHGGNSPLHTAGFRGERELVDLMLSHGADASARNDEGRTAGEVAASQGHGALATLLAAAARR
jgi:ankyrin repeat protein